jgi:mRNA interferase MazF
MDTLNDRSVHSFDRSHPMQKTYYLTTSIIPTSNRIELDVPDTLIGQSVELVMVVPTREGLIEYYRRSANRQESVNIDTQSTYTHGMNPKRGDIWLVNLDQTVDAEAQKVRPVVVLSLSCIDDFPLKIVLPITDWNSSYESDAYHVKLESSNETELGREFAVNVLQSKILDARHFIKEIGFVGEEDLKKMRDALIAATKS